MVNEEDLECLRDARGGFFEAAFRCDDRVLILKEVAQLLVDMMDILQQSDEERPILDAHQALKAAAAKLNIEVP